MSDWRIRTGAALGLAGAVVFLLAGGRPGYHGPVLSDCDGAVRELAIQYVPEAAGIVETTYRDFLRQLPPEVTVRVICPDRAAFEDLRGRVGPVRCRLAAVLTGHRMTCWSRDRWLALAPRRPGERALLLAPREEAGAHVWPERKGDHRVAFDLARALPDCLAAERSALAFDGGDFVADAHTAFVTPRVTERNVGTAVSSAAELRHALQRLLQRRVVLLREAPPHHAGMFMMLAGGRTALVGDPSLARAFASPLPQPDFTPETQRLFDAVAAACAAEGYRVVRMPVVPGRDGRTYLTPLNAILDERAGHHIVYMPVYRGAERLNDAAEAVWQSLGYEVRPVDCTQAYTQFGSLRCLVNVLSRSPLGSKR